MKNELSRRGNYSDYDFFEDAMRDFFPAFYGRRSEGHKYMRTDIKESDKGYEMALENSIVYTDYISMDETKVTQSNGTLTYTIVTKPYSPAQAFTITVTVGADKKIASYKIDVNGSTGESFINNMSPDILNDGKLFDMVRAVCDVKILPDAVMQAEDFSFYARVCPTVFFFLGLGSGMKLHSEKFDFDMSVLDVGVNLYKQLISSL